MRRAWWAGVAAVLAVLVTGFAAATDRNVRRREAAVKCHFPSCCGFTEQTTGCRFVGNRCRCPFISHRPLTFFMRRHHPLPLTVPFTYHPAYHKRLTEDHENREKGKDEDKDRERNGKEVDD
ncbi:uncharacterized protein LOC126996077 [Eriocheir sinensis]|uniref:uncharacterized protein LOC126996077 n=1 Tax=Eriocheir sinensis TaxID=95602 RepID=UPI0021C75A05|nr:uncharacterized protein LOC126996077 [Eriocheir sinensis]